MAAKRKVVEPQPYKKTPEQLAQWAAYEALCKQREQEANARKAASMVIEDKRKTVVAKLKAAEALHLDSQQYARAQELRKFAKAVMDRVPADGADEMKARAAHWEQKVLELADALDPVDDILESFAAPVSGPSERR
jgi:uncharacterized protein YhaN